MQSTTGRQPVIQSKLQNIGTNIFTEMSTLAAQHGAINLGQGFPDFPMPPDLVEAVYKAMKDGHNQYTHMAGYIPLREQLAAKAAQLYNAHIDPYNDITITPGGTYAIFTAFATILQPGDEVIVFEPAYDCYIPAIEVAGAKAITISLQFPTYHIDWEEVESRFTPQTKAIIINTPHNPSGAVLTEKDMGFLKSLAAKHDFFIVSDEVYEHLIFDGLPHESILRHPDLWARSFAVFSFGKTYHCTGWKLGYCIAPEALSKEFRKIHQYNAFSSDTPKQVGIAAYLQRDKSYNELGAFFQQKRDLFQNLMQASRFKALPSQGSYFQLYRYDAISDKKEKDFAIELTKTAGVTGIPVSAFYKDGSSNGVLRFCFGKREETLRAAAERLCKV